MSSSLQLLPTDLKTLILDFLPIDDIYALQQANKSFFLNLCLNNSFWSQKLFVRFIQYPNKSLNAFKLYESETPYYIPTTAEFNSFPHANLIWEELTSNQEDLLDSVEALTSSSEKAQAFAKRIFKVLSDPPMPALSLKRETQYLETSSWFENFLTEVHFGIYPPNRQQDKDYVFIADICRNIQDDLDRLNSPPTKKARCDRKRTKTEKGRRFSFSLAKIHERSNTLIVERRRHGAKNADKIEEVFHSIQQLIITRCRTINNYLSSLSQDKVFLKEYKRCWKEFTYSMIEMNSLMEPVEDLFKSNISVHGVGHFNNKKISAWREMTKVWIEEVYNNVAEKIKSSFEKVLIDTIMDESVSTKPKQSTNRCSFVHEDEFSNNYGGEEEEDAREKATKLLLKSFIAMSDLSLYKSDFTAGEEQMQPKFRLVNSLCPKIQKIMEQSEIVLNNQPGKLHKMLGDIQAIFNTVFNDEVYLEKISQLTHNQDSCQSNLDFENMPKIAGQYILLSKCKWETRLSSIYDSVKEMNSF